MQANTTHYHITQQESMNMGFCISQHWADRAGHGALSEMICRGNTSSAYRAAGFKTLVKHDLLDDMAI